MPRQLFRAVILIGQVVALACGAPSAPSNAAPPPPPLPVNASALEQVLLVCPTAAEVASLDPIRIEFDTATRSGALVCRAADGSVDMTAIQRYAYRGMLFLKNTRFNAPLPWTSGDAWQWFVGLDPRVYFFSATGASNCSNCQRGTAEVNINLDGGVNLTWPNLVTLAGILVHEARHIEVGMHRCGVNDFRADDLEAFGVHYYYRVWVSQRTDPATLPAEYRPYLDWSNCAMRNSAFCNDHC
jgi:hypothetical protein